MKCRVCNENSGKYYYCKNCYSKNKSFNSAIHKNELKDKVISLICEKHNVIINDVLGTSRKSNIAHCRHLVIYFLYEHLHYRYTDIAQMFKRDHTTVMHSKNMIDEMVQKNTKTKMEVAEIGEKIFEMKQEINIKTPEVKQTESTKQEAIEYICEDGHKVKSKAEREIDNFLFRHNVIHVYEKEYICKNGQKYLIDFFIPKVNLYIEYFGMTKLDYIESARKKLKELPAECINFAYITKDDDARLFTVLEEIFRKYNL